MRLDLFLKKSRIIKQRSKAKEASDVGAVNVNGIQAKPSKDVKVGDIIEINFTRKYLKFRIEMLPEGNLKKSDSGKLITILEEKEKEII